MKAKVLAIIPARGGSKGIPGKNLKPIAGKPLLVYSIERALQAESVGRVVVSTDDAQIAEVAKNNGAEVIIRPAQISGDEASSESALLHVLDTLHDKEGYEPDLVVFLQCTSPLTLPEDIDGTVNALLETNADTALSVTPFHYFLWQEGKNGDATGINHDKSVRLLRQQRQPQYLETGAVYVMRAQAFKESKHRFFGKTAVYVMPSERCLELDEPVDFEVARVLMCRQEKLQKSQMLPEAIEALVLDFDGVFTDNKVILLQNGTEAVVCNRSDGLVIERLKKFGIPVLVISTEKNPVVQKRCSKLNVECIHGIDDKRAILLQWLNEHQIDASNVVYVGNDINDLECMKAVGCAVAVSDAYPEPRAAARIVLSSSGGQGAVRELVELIFTKIGKGRRWHE